MSCAYCLTTNGPFENDHVVPRSRGGPDTPRNLVQACKPCNRDKRDLLPSEWLETVPPAVARIEAQITLAIGNQIRGRRDWKRPRAAANVVCYFCGGKIVKPVDGFLEFYDQEHGPPYRAATLTRFIGNGGREECGALEYPGNGECLFRTRRWASYGRIAVFTHAACGPDAGYFISFDRLLIDGATEWHRHIRGKVWDSVVFHTGIDEAWAAAKDLGE